MSTLIQKAQHILDEKNSKIIPENIKDNVQIFDVTGSLEEGIDTSDATATADDIVEDTSAYVDGVKIEGNIYDWRYQSGFEDFTNLQVEDISALNQIQTTCDVVLPQGYNSVVFTNNMGIVQSIPYSDIATAIELTSNKIVRGNTILGIAGTGGGTDTSDATATVNDIVKDTTAYVNGVKLEGALAERRGQHARVGLDKGYNLTRNDNDGFIKFDIHKFESAGSIPDEMAIDNDTTFSGDLDYSDIVTVSGLRANIIKKNETILGVTGTLETSGTDTSDATATENDLVADTTAYVNGVKITGKLFDNRNSSGYNEIDGTEIGDFTDAGYLYSGGYIKKLPSYLSGVVFSDEVLIKVKTPYSTITGEIGLTSDKLKKGVTILGVTGTLDAQGTDTSDATATADDLVEDTTAYVDGVKLNGNIIDGRTHNISADLDVQKMEDNSGTELVVNMKYVPDDSLKPNLVINSRTPLQVAVQYRDMVSELNITSDMIREGEKILGVTGTYSGSSIVYLEPGDKIHINMMALQTALLNVTDTETRARELAYDEENEDLFTLKMMDCINLGQPYEHSGMGLVMNGTTTFLKIFSWDPATDTNTVQLSDFIELVSIDYPTPANFDISALISTMSCLGGYSPTDLVFTYPSDAPIIPLVNDNTVKLLTRDGCDIGEVLTFNISSSFIRIVKAC